MKNLANFLIIPFINILREEVVAWVLQQSKHATVMHCCDATLTGTQAITSSSAHVAQRDREVLFKIVSIQTNIALQNFISKLSFTLYSSLTLALQLSIPIYLYLSQFVLLAEPPTYFIIWVKTYQCHKNTLMIKVLNILDLNHINNLKSKTTEASTKRI